MDEKDFAVGMAHIKLSDMLSMVVSQPGPGYFSCSSAKTIFINEPVSRECLQC